jgi:hypothetical protein
VHVWGGWMHCTFLGSSHDLVADLPKPIEALLGVRVNSISVAAYRSYAVADTGKLWAWGDNGDDANAAPLGHGEQTSSPLHKPIESLRGVKVDAVAANSQFTQAIADDGSVYTWGNKRAASSGALGLGPAVSDAGLDVPTPRRVPALRVATCGGGCT